MKAVKMECIEVNSLWRISSGHCMKIKVASFVKFCYSFHLTMNADDKTLSGTYEGNLSTCWKWQICHVLLFTIQSETPPQCNRNRIIIDKFYLQLYSLVLPAIDPCVGIVCSNGGSCQTYSSKPPQYICLCLEGYTTQPEPDTPGTSQCEGKRPC